MSYSYTFIGGAINSCAIDECAINNILRADYTVIPTGYAASTGTADVYSSHYWQPTGGSTTSGFITESYGQLAVIGGYSITSTPTTLSCWGHAEQPVGWLISTGSANAYGKLMVQIMHTERTVVVEGYGTEIEIEELNTNAVVLKTEDREASVAYSPSFYEVI